MGEIKNYFTNIIAGAILSGISISIGCTIYLSIGGVEGAILFAFGLLTVIHYGWALYTGQAGFIQTKSDIKKLILILLFNIAGCIITAWLIKYAKPEIIDNAVKIISLRCNNNLLQNLILSVGCGFIMTIAVKFARQKQYLPLLFGIPVFILCGFIHSIADAFYISLTPITFVKQNFINVVTYYTIIVLGNFVGCNLIRLINLDLNYDNRHS